MSEIKLLDDDYNSGYYACETDLPFDEKQSDLWKKGYHNKEKERLVRSVRCHLDYVSGKTDTCFNLVDNNNKAPRHEYVCFYYGKCKCVDKMLLDFLRLYVD